MEAITFDVMAEIALGMRAGPEVTALLVEIQDSRNPIIDALIRRFGTEPPATRGRMKVEAAINAQLAARRNTPDTTQGHDILSYLLNARYNDGQPMSDDSIRAELLFLLMAGHTSTAASLAWAFQLILAHPQVRARIEEELAAAGDDYTDASRFEYLDAAIKETMRLRPIVPLVFRRLAIPLRVGRHLLPTGVTLAPCIHLAHRRPDSFPEPDRFLPERFLNQSVDRHIWVPFGGGYRRCLGANFALFEMRAVIGTILTAQSIELAPAASSASSLAGGRFTHAPSTQLKVIIKKFGD
jgi:cytochrome P450